MKNTIEKLISGISNQEKLLFTKHLDTMIKAGIPINEALVTLVGQAKSKAFKKVIEKVLKDVENGQSLSKSLSKHPNVFNEFYISLIEVGEESGTLESNLDFLAKQMTKDYSLRKKVKGALFYPALVITATIVLGTFISFFILPKLVDFFDSFDVELPPTTKVLMYVAFVMKNYGLIIILSLFGLIMLSITLVRLRSVKYLWHKIMIRLPLFGKLIAYGQISRFARNFGTLIQSGVPITRSIEITANTLSNLKFKNDLVEVGKSLSKGKNIGKTLENKKFGEYPPIVSKMISIGEKTGKLDEALLYLGNFYEDEIDDMSKNLTTIIEPILLIVIAVAVGFVALAIISPIYELTGSIRN
jgi:type IV pilus assembly protein PilC